MSYILDALRKAEQERQSQHTPDLHSMQGGRRAPQRNAAKWLWIAAAVVVVIIAVNAAFWLGQARSPADGDRIASAEVQTPPSQQSPAKAAPAAQPNPVVAVQPAETAVAPVEQRPVQELWQVASHIKAAVQDLKFSFHVYSSKPQRRTIIINDHRMREGDQITADLTLLEITEDGVILAHPDTLVHVSILEQW